MPSPVITFLDFNLPNATTWLIFSFLLAMALFFKFSRLLSVRNLDVVMIFLLAPGLLLVQATRPQPMPIEQQPGVQVAAMIAQSAGAESAAALASTAGCFGCQYGQALESSRWLWWGYLWLLVGSVYFFCRCLLDLALVQRPALAPNLQIGGLAWLAGALMICLLAVAYRQVERHINPLPAANGAAPTTFLLLHPQDQLVFAVAFLWNDWPAWAVAALAFAGHFAVVVGLVLIAWRHFQDVAAGMAAATFYLLLPYTGLSVGQVHHVLPMALFLGTLLTYRRPILTGMFLGLATSATYFPLLALPIWVSFYRGRGVGRFLAAFLVTVGLGLFYVGWLLSESNQLGNSLTLALQSPAWQPWWREPKTEGFWLGVHWAYRIPVFLLYLSFVLVTTFWPTPKNLAHVIALSAAVFIGLQWWCADQGGIYILWYVPLLLLMIFRPNLQDRMAPPINPETDWLSRSLSWIIGRLRRFLRLEQPVKAGSP